VSEPAASTGARAASVVVFAVGFWALALGLTGLLAWTGYGIFTYAPEYFAGGIACWGLALALLAGFVPRVSFKKEDEDSPPLAGDEHPRLQAFVRDISRAAGAKAPDAVYVFHAANAFAGERRPRLLAKRESIVGIGLPLLAVLTESEARAVLAHEMGHHVAGDVRLGPWVHRTRRAIARAVDRLEGSSFWLHLPFVAYAELFLKASVRVSRAQELSADALSANVAGAAAAASALRKTEVLASAWGTYFHSEVLPLLMKGRIAPLLDGFERYWRAAQTPDTPAYEALAETLENGKVTQAADTHPVLAERIAALGDPAPLSDYAPPALGLLDDVERVEEKVLRNIMTDGKAELRPVEWDAIADAVWLPLWRETVHENRHAFSRSTPSDVILLLQDWAQVAQATRRGPAVASPEAEKRRAARLTATWFAVALADRGWRIEAPPGLAVLAHRGGKTLAPFVLVADMAKAPDARRWAQLCSDNGLD
jgi:Zn-dependent protease with chaperone function